VHACVHHEKVEFVSRSGARNACHLRNHDNTHHSSRSQPRGDTSSIDLKPAPVSHRSDSLYFIFSETESAWGGGEEYRVFTH